MIIEGIKSGEEVLTGICIKMISDRSEYPWEAEIIRYLHIAFFNVPESTPLLTSMFKQSNIVINKSCKHFILNCIVPEIFWSSLLVKIATHFILNNDCASNKHY